MNSMTFALFPGFPMVLPCTSHPHPFWDFSNLVSLRSARRIPLRQFRSAPPGFVDSMAAENPGTAAKEAHDQKVRRRSSGPGLKKAMGFSTPQRDAEKSWKLLDFDVRYIYIYKYIIQRPSWKNSINSVSTLNLFRGSDFM